MNNLLFTALLIALLYYFFYYLPSKKPTANPPLKHHQSTQTEALASRENILNGPEAISFPSPHYIQHEPGMIKLPEDTSTLEATLDQLIKSMNDLAQSLN